MTNLKKLKSLCTALCNTFYPDLDVLESVLDDEGLDADATAGKKDKTLLALAIRLVKGFVETSHSENGVSMATDRDAVNEAIASWCSDYGLDEDEYLISPLSIRDASHLW